MSGTKDLDDDDEEDDDLEEMWILIFYLNNDIIAKITIKRQWLTYITF